MSKRQIFENEDGNEKEESDTIDIDYEADISNQEAKLDIADGVLKSYVLYHLETIFNSKEVVRVFSNRNNQIVDFTNLKAKSLQTFKEHKFKMAVIEGFNSSDSDKYFILINSKMREGLANQLILSREIDEELLLETLDVCSSYLKGSLDCFIKNKTIARKSTTYDYYENTRYICKKLY
jgi:hypothetical protein